MTGSVRRFHDWLILSRRTGKQTVTQPANVPIKLYWAGSIVRWAAPDESVRSAAHLLATGALTWWAADELFRGDSPLRRMLGATALGWIAYSLVRPSK